MRAIVPERASKLRGGLFAVACLFFACIVRTAAGQAPPPSPPQDSVLAGIPVKFYESPDRKRIVALIRNTSFEKPNDPKEAIGERIHVYSFMGFMAETAKLHPDWIAGWGAAFDGMGPAGKQVLAMAVSSAASLQAREELAAWRSRGNEKIFRGFEGRDMSKLLRFNIVSPDILSAYSGAYHASGDTFYLDRMIHGFAISLPFGDGSVERRPNAVLSHLIPPVIFHLAFADGKAMAFIEAEVAANRYGVGQVLGDVLQKMKARRNQSPGRP